VSATNGANRREMTTHAPNDRRDRDEKTVRGVLRAATYVALFVCSVFVTDFAVYLVTLEVGFPIGTLMVTVAVVGAFLIGSRLRARRWRQIGRALLVGALVGWLVGTSVMSFVNALGESTM